MATHDYVIANQTATSFRSDLNDVLQAILTMNTSASTPPATAAGMIWHDTTDNELKIRNSADDAWITLFALDQTSDEAELRANILQAASGATDAPTVKSGNGDTTLVLQPPSVSVAKAGTNTTSVMTPYTTAQSMEVSLASKGYCKLPNGLIWNWGTISVPNNETTVTSETFSQAFATACFQVQLTVNNTGSAGQDNFDAYVTTSSTTGFSTRNAGKDTSWTAEATTVSYFAIGH
jgi:hypothetical protein